MWRTVRNASIGVKIALAPTFTMLCLLAIGAIGWLANDRLSTSLIEIGQARVPYIAKAGSLAQKLSAIHAMVNQSLAWEGAGFKADKIAALDKRVLDEVKQYAALLKTAAEDPSLSSESQRLLSVTQKEFTKYADNVKSALDIKTGMLGNAASYMTTLEASNAAMTTALADLVKDQAQLAETAVGSARRQSADNRLLIGSGIGVALLAAFALSGVVARLIVRPLAEASRLANAVAQGNLTQRCESSFPEDATGQVLSAINAVSSNLSEIVVRIRTAADEVNTASCEIASGNVDLSQRTEKTAAALQHAASMVTELAGTIAGSANNARDADQLARDASTVAREGGEVVNDVITTMETINRHAKKIGEIIGVIDGIAFQTNILALNAAVEAARAGEQGRGFSVVASEVRTLAQRSAEAAKEIRSLISTSVESIDSGVSKVHRAGETMSRIVSAIEKVSGTVEAISAAAAQQATGISQVNRTVADMDHATQQNAALAEQAGAATESLRTQADSLVTLLARFQTREASTH